MPTQSPQWIAAARVLRRAGFGAIGAQIDAVCGTDMVTTCLRRCAATPMPTRVR